VVNDVAVLLVGIAAGAVLYAAMATWRRNRGSVIEPESLSANTQHRLDLLRRAHGALAACVVQPEAEPLWSKGDPPPRRIQDRMVAGATAALEDGRDRVLSEDDLIVAAGDGRFGGAVVFRGSDARASLVQAVTHDLRTLLADYQIDHTRGRIAMPPPLNTPPWLVPESVDAVAFGICEAAHKLTGKPSAVVVRDPTSQIASVVAVSAGTDRRLLHTVVALSSAAGRACMGDITTTATGMGDLLGETRANRRVREALGAAFPLRNGHAGAGALVVFGLPKTVDSSLTDRITAMAREAGPVMRRVTAVRASEQRALIDELTGQPNQRGLERAVREHREGTCSLLCVDIDQFDQLSETARGAALRHSAIVFRSTLRDYDVSARLREEKFAIFLPDTPFHHAFTVADRVRVAIGKSLFNPGGAQRQLTCSLGVASVPETVPEVDGLIAAAAKALDVAKTEGNNRVGALPPRQDNQPLAS
jgi:diguanylate cyclase (GGDEF)-like protein